MIYYVNAKAKTNGNGSKDYPFKTINQAAAVAQAGDEVIVKPGIYREKVVPRFGGTEEKRITYKSEKPLGAVITGSEILKGWKKYKGDVRLITVYSAITILIQLMFAVTGILLQLYATQVLLF